MMPSTVLLRLSVAILIGANLSEVCSSPLREVDLLVEEEDVENKTREIELNIDLDDLPASIIDDISRGDYSKIIELQESIAAMNESGATDDVLDGLSYGRWERTIFGHDDRRPVESSQLYSYPYCAIGYLESGCTAAFIGPRHALTAAHCVVGKSTSQLNLWRRKSCNSPGELMHYAYDSYIPRGYTRNRLFSFLKRRYDYALLLYRETSPCYLRFGYRGNWGNYGFKVIGYPGDKRASDLSHCSHHSMFYSTCSRSYTYGSYRFRYRCDAVGGNSGSPLMSRDPENGNADRIVYGIHTRSAVFNNYGVRITQTRFCNFVEWMQENGHTAVCGSQPCC